MIVCLRTFLLLTSWALQTIEHFFLVKLELTVLYQVLIFGETQSNYQRGRIELILVTLIISILVVVQGNNYTNLYFM
jgi:hypothetical protein